MLYESLYENKLGRLWVRPKEMFFENVNLEGQSVPRFKAEEISYRTMPLAQPGTRELFYFLYKEIFGEELSPEKLSQRIEQHRDLHLLVAFDQDQALGFKIGYKTDENVFYSWLGGVRPAYRRLGIAQELMRRQHLYCELEKIKLIKTKTRPHFAEMLVLNLRAGFRITEHRVSSDGNAEIMMEKKL